MCLPPNTSPTVVSDVGDETYLFIKRWGSDGYSQEPGGLEEEVRTIWKTEADLLPIQKLSWQSQKENYYFILACDLD